MPKKTDDRDIMDKVLETLTHQGVYTMTQEQRSDYLSAMMLVSYQIMRKVEGDEFVRGFFESALADMAENPSPVQFPRPN